MKALKQETVNTFEEVALEGAAHLKAFFAYEGDNPRFFQRAKLGAMAINGYARIRQGEVGHMRLNGGLAE